MRTAPSTLAVVVCLGASACSLIVSPSRFEPCDGDEPSECADGQRSICVDGYVVIEACPMSCDADSGVCTGCDTDSERCDDGNRDSGDGCSATCEIEDQGQGGESCADPERLNLVATPDGTLIALARAEIDIDEMFDDTRSSCGSGAGRPDIVYQIDLAVAGELMIAVSPSFGDLIIALRGADGAACVVPEGEVTCSDQGPANFAETIGVSVPDGTYFLLIDSINSRTEFTTEIRFVPE